MKSFLCIFVILAITSKLEAADSSYGDLAGELVPKYYGLSKSGLSILNDDVMPTDVKTLRKSILYCRDMLDIFAYAYPNKTKVSSKSKDIWIKLRGDLDDGYTTLGDFQDLAHSGVNYTQKELHKRRKACLDWKDDFVSNDDKYDYESYATKPSTTELFFRPSEELSQFYWEYVGVYPSFTKSGLQNIAGLEAGLINLANKNYTELVSLQNVYEDPQHIFFHDYRKLVRSITTVSDYFTVFTQAPCVTTALTTLDDIYNNLGDINDNVVAYEYYVSNGETDKAQKEQEKIVAAWQTFISWIQSAQMNIQYSCLSNNLIQ